MAAILQFLHNLYTLSVVCLTLFFLEIIILFRSASRALCGNSTITATQYLKLIERKNPASRYKAAGLKDQNCKECSVCLSEFKEEEEIRKVRQCNHTFHKNCLDMWLQQDSPTCPLCRISVLPEEIVTKYMQQRNNQDYYGSDERMLVLLSALHVVTLNCIEDTSLEQHSLAGIAVVNHVSLGRLAVSPTPKSIPPPSLSFTRSRFSPAPPSTGFVPGNLFCVSDPPIELLIRQ